MHPILFLQNVLDSPDPLTVLIQNSGDGAEEWESLTSPSKRLKSTQKCEIECIIVSDRNYTCYWFYILFQYYWF